jgi:integrase
MANKQGRRGWGSLRRLPSSKRYQASYTGPDMARHTNPSGTFGTRLDAEAWLASERRLIDADRWTPPKRRSIAKRAKTITGGEDTEKWIAQRNVKPRTRIEYEALYHRLIKEPIGSTSLPLLTADAVRAWFASLGTGTPTRNAHAYGLLHAVMSTAVSDELIAVNPCRIPRVFNQPRKREPVILSPTDIHALADKIEPAQFRALVLVLGWLGPRWGEAIELRRSDFGPECSTLTIHRAATHRGECRIGTTKSARGRSLVVPPHIREDIAEHMAAHVANDLGALVFPALTSTPSAYGCHHLNDSVLARHMRKAITTLGHSDIRIHDLRHTAATNVAQRANLPEVMNYLGHSTVVAAMRYQGIVTGRDQEIAEALSAHYLGKRV